MNDILTKNPLFRLLIRKNSCTTSLSAWNEALLRFAEELAAVSEQLSDYRQLYRIFCKTYQQKIFIHQSWFFCRCYDICFDDRNICKSTRFPSI